MIDETKPGWQTSEFWMTVASIVLGSVISAYGVTPPADGQSPEHALGCACCSFAAICQAGVAVWAYVTGRAAMKAKALDNTPEPDDPPWY